MAPLTARAGIGRYKQTQTGDLLGCIHPSHVSHTTSLPQFSLDGDTLHLENSLTHALCTLSHTAVKQSVICIVSLPTLTSSGYWRESACSEPNMKPIFPPDLKDPFGPAVRHLASTRILGVQSSSIPTTPYALLSHKW